MGPTISKPTAWFQNYYKFDPWGFDPGLDFKGRLLLENLFGIDAFSLQMQIPRTEEDDASVLCFARARCEVSPEVIEILRNGRPPGDLTWSSAESWPFGYQTHMVEIATKLNRASTQILHSLRWFLGLTGGPVKLEEGTFTLRCHLDPELPSDADWTWIGKQIPDGVSLVGLPKMQSVGALWKTLIVPLNDPGVGECPLGHEILLVAWNVRMTHAPTALAVGSTALEAGVKAFLSKHLAESKWLIENAPSPPIIDILQRWLPTLKIRGSNREIPSMPKPLLRSIRDGIELRNKVAHGIPRPVTTEFTERFLLSVRDVLYLLDFYSGAAWAPQHLQPATRAAMGFVQRCGGDSSTPPTPNETP